MEKSPLVDPFQKLILLSELENAYCQLNHGPYDRQEDHPAVDYVVCPLGAKQAAAAGLQLTIPVCRCCIDGLHDEEWTLLFCLNCLASKWILRPLARLQFRHHLIWLASCPECSKELSGAYFN